MSDFEESGWYTVKGDDGYTRISQNTENLPLPSDIGAEYLVGHETSELIPAVKQQ